MASLAFAVCVAAAVVGCCSYAVSISVRRVRRLAPLAQLEASSSLKRLRARGAAEARRLPLPDGHGDSVQDGLQRGGRVLTAATNELLLDVQLTLEQGAAAGRMAWRICAGSAVSAVLLLVWTQRGVSLGIAVLGAISAAICASLGRSADSRSRRARQSWNDFATGLREIRQEQSEASIALHSGNAVDSESAVSV